MKKIAYIILIAIVASCKQKVEDNFFVNVNIKGLKKGTVYLEKVENEKITVIDSIYIDNETEDFRFSNHISEPEMFIISLDKLNTKQLTFFSEATTVTIKTSLDKFFTKASIEGSKLQNILKKHDSFVKKINNQNLDILKLKFEATKKGNTELVEKLENRSNQNLKRQYLFSANYAIANKDKAIAPFIAYTRMDNASISLKTKIYDALTPEIKESKYGKLLKASLN